MIAIIIIIVLLPGILTGFLILHNTPKHRGKLGEEKVQNLLRQLPEEYLVINDLMLRTSRGTTQIDHIVVSRYGVFAIETKNYRGNIYGDDNCEQWKQIILTDVTYRKNWWNTYTYVTKSYFYNPVKQALGHTNVIKKVLTLWPNLKIIPIVVFVGNADISHVKSQYHVVYGNDLISTIKGYKTVYLNDFEIWRIQDLLFQLNVKEYVTENQHIHNIKVIKEEKERIISQGICPKCGGSFVLRNGKYGRFYGCSNYPRCKFTLNE